MLEELGGQAPRRHLGDLVDVERHVFRNNVERLISQGILVSRMRNDTEYIAFSGAPDVKNFRILLAAFASMNDIYRLTVAVMRRRAAGNSKRPLKEDWLEHAFSVKRTSQQLAEIAAPTFFGPNARYQILALLATFGDMRKCDMNRVIKSDADSLRILCRNGLVTRWRSGRGVYLGLHPKYPAKRELINLLRAFHRLWPAFKETQCQFEFEEPPEKPMETWTGKVDELCDEPIRTRALLLSRLAGFVDATTIQQLFGYDRTSLRAGMRLLLHYGILKVQRTSQGTKGYSLDKSFPAFKQLAALLDKLLAQNKPKWKARLQQIKMRRPLALVLGRTTSIRDQERKRTGYAPPKRRSRQAAVGVLGRGPRSASGQR